MIKIGVADYGMNVWYGGCYDYEARIRAIREIGFDGLERLYPDSAENALYKAAKLKENGMGFATCNAQTVELSIKWTTALGGQYIWASIPGGTFDVYLRQLRELSQVCKQYGIDVVVHNHMGQTVETQEQVEIFLEKCPDAKLLFDVRHLAVAGGDVRYIAEKYYDRIAAYHLKSWQTSDTPDAEVWHTRGHFCGLGQGDLFTDNEFVVKNALKRGYDGWFFIEHDTHLQDPLIDLKESYDVLQKWIHEA